MAEHFTWLHSSLIAFPSSLWLYLVSCVNKERAVVTLLVLTTVTDMTVFIRSHVLVKVKAVSKLTVESLAKPQKVRQ